MGLIRAAPLEEPIDIPLTPGRLAGLERQGGFHSLACRDSTAETGKGVSLEEEPFGVGEPFVVIQPIESDLEEILADLPPLGCGIQAAGELDCTAAVLHHVAQDLGGRRTIAAASATWGQLAGFATMAFCQHRAAKSGSLTSRATWVKKLMILASFPARRSARSA